VSFLGRISSIQRSGRLGNFPASGQNSLATVEAFPPFFTENHPENSFKKVKDLSPLLREGKPVKRRSKDQCLSPLRGEGKSVNKSCETVASRKKSVIASCDL
jgi:hypothetical protein